MVTRSFGRCCSIPLSAQTRLNSLQLFTWPTILSRRITTASIGAWRDSEGRTLPKFVKELPKFEPGQAETIQSEKVPIRFATFCTKAGGLGRTLRRKHNLPLMGKKRYFRRKNSRVGGLKNHRHLGRTMTLKNRTGVNRDRFPLLRHKKLTDMVFWVSGFPWASDFYVCFGPSFL